MSNTQQYIPELLASNMNSTFPGGFPNGLYGMNFIDILFKHVMESGIEGLSLLFILQLYFYLSLDRIKDLFKYFNDKLAEHGKVKLEAWCSALGNIFNAYVEGGVIKIWEFIKNVFSRIFLGRKSRNGGSAIDTLVSKVRIGALGPLVLRNDGKTKYTLGIDTSNRVDVMSICSYILQERERLNINDICTRSETSKRHTEEVFTLPSELDIGDEEVDIRFVQNVNLAMVCESNHLDEETVKDFILNAEVLKNTLSLKDLDEFETLLAEVLEKLSPIPSHPGHSKWPRLIVLGWNSSPNCITNSDLEKFWTLVYLSRNNRLLESAMRFLAGSDSFNWDGKQYTLNEPFWDGMSVGKEINSMSGIKELMTQLDEHYRKTMIDILEDEDPSLAQAYLTAAQVLVQHFEAELDTTDPMFVEFRSESMTEFELDNYARNWMYQRIQSYYQDNMQRDGDKITIYKMYITYKKEQIDVANPEFQEWLDKHGLSEEEFDRLKEEEEEEKKKKEEDKKKKKPQKDMEDEPKPADAANNGSSKTKKDDDNSDSDSDSEDDAGKKKGKKGKKKGKGLPGATTPYFYGGSPPWAAGGTAGYGAGVYGGAYTAYSREPYIPPKTVKKDKLIPKCKCKLIKRDRKPLEYLYLPQRTMDSLKKYLKNFKNNKERYEKFGLPYRGGILLSGVPGCGKSSTILATATFLKKDIYYLDLGAIKTNEELKLCVDHIRTASKNGGIIIFEDIDCMSNIVLRRGDGRGYDGSAAGASESLTAATAGVSHMSSITTAGPGGAPGSPTLGLDDNDDNCDALSLSFLLNVLDGTMAPEDVIFIMTTNRPKCLDPALIRPGRIDLSFNVGRCTKFQLINIYKDLYDKKMPDDIVELFPEDKWITAKVILHLFHNSFNSSLDVYNLMRPFIEDDETLAEKYRAEHELQLEQERRDKDEADAASNNPILSIKDVASKAAATQQSTTSASAPDGEGKAGKSSPPSKEERMNGWDIDDDFDIEDK